MSRRGRGEGASYSYDDLHALRERVKAAKDAYHARRKLADADEHAALSAECNESYAALKAAEGADRG